MRHVFILNPAAGKHQPALALAPAIEAACEAAGVAYEILTTTAPGEGTTLAADAIRRAGQEGVRLYACGGDGTLLEVLAAVPPGSGTELAHVPCGSGNDFVRMLGGNDRFLDLAALVAASAVPVDGIRYGEEGKPPRYAVNVAAAGIDAATAYEMGRVKRWPLVSGSMAYNLALVKVFFGKLGYQLKVTMDTPEGSVDIEGRYLFALGANGQYYGGGYHAAPESKPDDGLLDFVMVEKISRLKILKLLPKYKAGTHLGHPAIHTWRGTGFTVHSDTPIPVTLDGECFLSSDFKAELIPAAYRFVLPEEPSRPEG